MRHLDTCVVIAYLKGEPCLTLYLKTFAFFAPLR